MVALLKKDAITGESMGTGRRKSSVASVRVKSGSGKITINNKDISEFFTKEQDRQVNAVLVN